MRQRLVPIIDTINNMVTQPHKRPKVNQCKTA